MLKQEKNLRPPPYRLNLHLSPSIAIYRHLSPVIPIYRQISTFIDIFQQFINRYRQFIDNHPHAEKCRKC